MLTLSLDTATGPCSVAVLKDADTLSYRREERHVHQARMLVPMIEQALSEAGIGYSNLNQVVTTVGPGSFTGLRVGLATARGIGLATGIPVHGVTTLAAQAYGGCVLKPILSQRERELFVVSIIKAGHDKMYACHPAIRRRRHAQDLESVTPNPVQSLRASQDDILLLSTEELLATFPQERHCFTGYLEQLPDDLPHTAAATSNALNAARLAIEHPECILPASPLYIRPPDAKPQAPLLKNL